MRMETVFVAVLGICFFLAIYLVVLSLYVVEDELQRVQLLAMATSFFVGGAVITVLYIIVKTVAMQERW